MVPEGLEEEMVRFCLSHLHARSPATISGMIDLPGLKEINIDIFWVRNFVVRHKEHLCFQRLTVPEKNRHDVSPGDNTLIHWAVKSIMSPSVWNVDQTRAGCVTKIAPPEVMIGDQSETWFCYGA
jgi:hypothetical protein